jgi:hypothetical protein
MRIKIGKVFRRKGRTAIETKKAVRIAGIQLMRGCTVVEGVLFAGIDLVKCTRSGLNIEVEEKNGILIIVGIYTE